MSDPDDHDRLVRLEERVAQWMASVERRLSVSHATMMWLLGALASGAVALLLAVLTGTLRPV